MSTTKALSWFAAASLAVACSSSSDAGSSGSPPPGTTPPSTTPPPATTAPPGGPCSGKEALTGDLDWKLTVGAVERLVHVHVPKTYAPAKPTPVVLSFHGYSSNGSEQDTLAGMSAKADQAGFIAVHPEGIAGTGAQSWNGGSCCGDAASTAVDDVAFVGKLIDEITSKLCVDARRVFATGMSNGGFLSHRLACEMSTRIAAVAPVAGVLGVPTCKPLRSMSVFHFHGTSDEIIPYAGAGAGYPSVTQTLAGWASRSGCSAIPRETSKKGDVRCVTYDGCTGGAEVNLCTVEGGGHTWPGGLAVPALGRTTTDIKATDAMWDFFVKHPLPE